MTGLRYADLVDKPVDLLEMTTLTSAEFRLLVPVFETVFQFHMARWRLDGNPRTERRFTVYRNCPLPAPEDRLLFILVYLKTNPLQATHGRRFALPQGKANQWLHVLLPSLRAALRQLGASPSQSLAALAAQLDLLVGEAVEVASPLFVMDLSDASHAPKTRMNRKAVLAARKHAKE